MGDSFPLLPLPHDSAEPASSSPRSPTPVGLSTKSPPTPSLPSNLGSPPEHIPAPVFANQAVEDVVIAQQKTRVQMLGSAGAKVLNEILVFQTEPET